MLAQNQLIPSALTRGIVTRMDARNKSMAVMIERASISNKGGEIQAPCHRHLPLKRKGNGKITGSATHVPCARGGAWYLMETGL